jgi:hypothetical protein
MKRYNEGKVSTPPLTLAVKMWPTPRAEYDSGMHKGKPDTLHSAVKIWPTPRANDAEKRGQIANDPRSGLPVDVKYYPTPAARDYRNQHADGSEAFMKRQEHPRGVNLVEQIQRDGEIGQLNPTWVEWLMGWPLGWTDLKPLEMDKFREWWQQHGGY